MTRIAVDVERLAEFIERLQHTQAELTRARDEADARIRQLHARWTGSAAQAQESAHEQWRAGAGRLQEALAALHAAARTAQENYAAAVFANRRMWRET
jgi:WXG100 family type VII secretion target